MAEQPDERSGGSPRRRAVERELMGIRGKESGRMRRNGGVLAWLSRLGRWLLLTVLVGAAGGVICRHLVLTHLDEQIRVRVEGLFAAHYRDMVVQIEAARRVEGKGIEVRGFSLRSRAADASDELVHVDELFLACRTDLRQLLSGNLQLRRLTLRRMKLRAACRDGSWNVARLFPLPEFGGSIPRIDIENSTIELRDVGRTDGRGWILREIDVHLGADVDEESRASWKFAGSLLGDHFQRVRFQGRLDPKTLDWSVWGALDALEMSPHMLGAVPADAAQYLSFLTTLRARADLSFRLSHCAEDADPFQFVVEGRLVEGQVEDARLPLALADVEADVYCDNRQLRINQLTARSGPTSVWLSGLCEDYLSESPRLVLSARIDQLPLDGRLRAALPDSCRAAWEDFSPSGTVDVVAELRLVGHQVDPDIRVICRDVEFAYDKFPYRLREGRGVIHLVGNRMRVADFTAVAGGQTIHLAAEFENPGPTSTGWLTLHCSGGVPLNDELIAAMKPEGQRIVRSLRPAGSVAVTGGRIEKRVPGEGPHSRWELQLVDCSLQYDRFPYAIEKITGQLILADGHWQFRDLRGYHGSNYILCDGDWRPDDPEGPGGGLRLTFRCWDVPLEDSLRTALIKLHPAAERLWDDLRPRGAVDHVVIALEHNARTDATRLDVTVEKWPPEQNLEGRTISLKPTWLPMRFDEVTGRIRFADGQLELTDLSATRDKSRIELAGRGFITPDHRWEIQWTKLIADRVLFEQELIDVLPAGIRSGVRQLGYAGPVSLQGSAVLRGGAGLPLTAGWDVVLDVDSGTLRNELKLDQMHGAVRLTGEKTANDFYCRGELEIDSLMCRGVQVTQIRGPLWLDSRQVILGSQAGGRVPGTLPRQVSARSLGGEMALDGHLLLEDELRFALEWSLSNGDLGELARHMHNHRHDISGKVFSMLRVQGSQSGPHTWLGSGEVRLREADIYELPIMVQLLSFLSLRKPDTTAFTRSDIDFRIQGEQIHLDRIDFSGDAISLKGTGWMDWHRRVNVDFYTLVGRQEIPIPLLRALLAEASRNILLIQVAGTVDEPVIKRKALPELDDTLQRIFPEAVPRTSGLNVPWTRGARGGEG